MSDSTLLIYKSIANFIKSLSDIYGTKQSPIKLYSRLIKKTSIIHEKAINKHITIFREFCIKNNEGIVNKDIKKFENTKISYSENVFIEFKEIFDKVDNDAKNTIWEHLLYISALVYPAGKAKEILKKNIENKDNSLSQETNFITDIIEKVEKHLDPNTSNPMEAITNIMKTDVFTDLLSSMSTGISSGQLDMGKLLGTVQNMMTQISTNDGGSNIDMSMLTNMLGNLTTDMKK